MVDRRSYRLSTATVLKNRPVAVRIVLDGRDNVGQTATRASARVAVDLSEAIRALVLGVPIEMDGWPARVDFVPFGRAAADQAGGEGPTGLRRDH